ncbi:endoplasmic reticulum protein [Rhodotorula toruloides NP11]|uniref:Endoplasmic reticulum protein n=1 Tax=Rhodotorula toruloides (strain NP11) TaxID=1130832 RepID=M7WNZ3_RHOT1|nr:endoplasmic reticulum protein [Rhodotorula toruloides NP11]EMS22232.1 endoplasmic reticulum protein [Rhodotorula toruloides NP11]
MVGSFVFALTYLLGGITFLPLCLAVLLAFLYYTSPVVRVPRKTGIPDRAAKSHSTASGEQEDEVEPINVYRAGWLTVRRTYEPLKVGNDGTYVGMLASGYRSFMDNRSRDPRRSKPKDRFFAVLKQNILFLYEGEDQNECWAAIEVSAHDIVIFPEGNIDGELYVKRTAIQLKPRRTEEEAEDATSPTGHAQSEETAYDLETGRPLPWFIFAKVNSDKEDWYHSLQLASRLGNPPATTSIARDRALFDSEDMARLVEAIDAQPDSIPMRWFNALIGRIFLSVNRTSSLENYITSRIVRKLKRVKLPSMLSEIQVREVNVGASVPLFSKPMLKDLTAEGDASMEVHVAYVGEARVTIETEATVSLSSRFKPYTVRLVLAVVLKELEGTMLVKMKRPPSNRIWFGFTQMPKMVLSVEPVVSARQIKWSMVTGPIESRIRELIMESIVVPHMDDLSFFSTLAEPLFRGGIYGAFLRADKSTASADELDAPSDKKNEVDPSTDGPAEEDLVGEATPSVSKGNEVREAVSSATKESGAQLRAAAMRRRRSSEGDRPLDLTPMSTSPAATPSASAPRSPSSASSSVTGLAGLSASLASWREKNSSSTSMNGSSGTSTSRTTTRWFSKSSTPVPSTSSASTTPAPSVRTNDSTDSIASASSATTATGETSAPPHPEVSASQLRDILAKRAEERDREREKEREKAAAVAAATPKSPALPNRPSFVKALPTPPPASPAASTTSRDASLAAPPPLPRRHSPSASVDSASTSTTASTASSLLASWRTKVPTSATERSEALSAAKESMKRWGANWAAKRAQAQQEKEERAKRVEDSDRPVGESPEKERGGSAGAGEGNGGGYRDYRKGKSVSSGRGGGGIADYFGTNGSSDSLVSPKTPPRSIPRASVTAASTHPAGQLSSSASSTSSGHFAPSSPSASTALSTSSALANSSPSTSPAKPSMLASGPPTMSAGAGYGRRMMTLPGIRDEDKRKKVSEDHLGGGAAALAASEGEKANKAETEGPEVKEEATSASGTPPVETSAESAVASESSLPAEDAETERADVASTASTVEEPQFAVDEPVSSSTTAEPPALPPRDSQPISPVVEADVPAAPPLPPRKDAVDPPKEVEKAAPFAIERDSTAKNVPPLPPRNSAAPVASSEPAVQGLKEDEADEAGWGLDNEVVVEEGQS